MQKIISQVIKTQINNFHQSPRTESKSETGSFKLTASQKEALRRIAAERGVAVSGLVTASIEFYLEFLNHTNTLVENKAIILPILERIR